MTAQAANNLKDKSPRTPPCAADEAEGGEQIAGPYDEDRLENASQPPPGREREQQAQVEHHGAKREDHSHPPLLPSDAKDESAGKSETTNRRVQEERNWRDRNSGKEGEDEGAGKGG
jgi:hypothetical protein